MCFIQTIENPFDIPKSDLDNHIKQFSSLFPSGSHLKFYATSEIQWSRVPPKVITPAPVQAPIKETIPWQTISQLPIGTTPEIRLSSLDKNTSITQNQTAFKNIGPDQICWAQAASQAFNTGSLTITWAIDKAKEYTGMCSNTEVGFRDPASGNTFSVSGDGKLKGSSASSKCPEAIFSLGSSITLK